MPTYLIGTKNSTSTIHCLLQCLVEVEFLFIRLLLHYFIITRLVVPSLYFTMFTPFVGPFSSWPLMP